MFYLFHHDYWPGEAANNRVSAYIKYLSEKGIPTTVVFPYPNVFRDRVKESYPSVRFVYLWSENIKRRPFRTINLFIRYFILSTGIRKGDTVFLYSLTELLPRMTRLRRRGVRILHERTENPELFRLDGTLGAPTLKEYYSCCNGIDKVFVISNSLRNLYVANGVPAEKVEIVNMIVDGTRFEGIKKAPERKYIAYCGSLWNNAKDGIDCLIKAFASIADRHPDYALMLAGRIPEEKEKRANLELIKSLGLEGRVLLPGYISPENMPGLLKNAQMLVLARPEGVQASYGFPTKLGEYLASGNPVVVSPVGEIPLFLEDGVSAIFARAGDAGDLASRMEWVINNPLKAAQIGLRGEEVARTHFNYRTETSKIVQFI